MRIHHWVAALLLCGQAGAVPHGEAPVSFRDRLRLANGDEMQGAWESMSGTRLGFTPRWSRRPVDWNLSSVESLFRDVPVQEPAADSTLVTLTNGDRLRGRSVRVEDDRVSFTTAWGQPVSLPRAAVGGLDVFHPRSLLMRAPSRGEAWQASQNAPRNVLGGVLFDSSVTSASVEIPPLPEQIMMECRFRMSEGTGFHQFHLLGIPEVPGNNRQILIQMEQQSLFVRWPEAGFRVGSWREQIPRVPAPGSLQVWRLYAHLKTGEVSFCLNGKLLKTWTVAGLPERSFVNPSRLVVFAGQREQSLLIESFEIRAWEGPPAEAIAVDRKPLRDLLWLSTGHAQQGRLVSMDAESLHFKTESGTVETHSLSRVAWVQLGGIPLSSPRADNEVEVHLGVGGDRVTLADARFDGGILRGSSAAWIVPPQPPAAHIRALLRDPPPVEEDASLIRFLNGDLVQGELIRSEGGIGWIQSPHASEAFPTELRLLGHLRSPSRRPPPAFRPEIRVIFAEGDSLALQNVSMDARHVEGDTGWGQRVALNRKGVQTLEPIVAEESWRLTTVGNLSEWKVDSHRSDGSLPPRQTSFGIDLGANRQVGRPLKKLPARYRVEMVLEKTQPSAILTIQLFGDPFTNTPRSRVLLTLMGTYFHFVLEAQQGLVRQNEGIPFGLGAETGSIGVALEVDAPEKKMKLFLNDVLMQEFALTAFTEAELRETVWLGFAVRQPRGGVLLQELRVVSVHETPIDAESAGWVELMNGDVVHGQPLSWNDGRLLLQQAADAPALPIPRNRIRRVGLNPQGVERPRKQARDVVVETQGGGGRMTVSLESWGPAGLRGESPLFEETLEIPKEALIGVRWNPHSARRHDDRLPASEADALFRK